MSGVLPFPELETERLRMRMWRADDFEPMAAFFADEASARYIGGTANRRDAWRRVAAVAGHWTLRGYGIWALEVKTDRSFAGWCGLWCPEEFPEIELGWSLLSQHRGTGLATEAASRARDHALHAMRLPTLVSYIVEENEASKKVARRLGAAPDGTIEIQGKRVTVWRHPAPKKPN